MGLINIICATISELKIINEINMYVKLHQHIIYSTNSHLHETFITELCIHIRGLKTIFFKNNNIIIYIYTYIYIKYWIISNDISGKWYIQNSIDYKEKKNRMEIYKNIFTQQLFQWHAIRTTWHEYYIVPLQFYHVAIPSIYVNI